MADLLWAKFYWTDWLSDIAVRRCSLAARGLWMDMLCIAAQHDPIGYVAVNGEACTNEDIARVSGSSIETVDDLIKELERNGVFSRDRKGKIYNRRMINDAKKRKIARENGKNGGNPSLRNNSSFSTSDNQNPTDGVKGGLNTQRLETRDQEKESCPKSPSAPPDLGLLFPEPDKPAKAKSGEKKGKPDYSKEFEDFWRAYPTDPGMSKKEAWDAWDKLPPDEQQAVGAAVPGFRQWLKKQSPDYRTVHAVRFITQRRFENFVSSTAPAEQVDWKKALDIARRKQTWDPAKWGPMPNQPGCMVPPELISADDGKGWSIWKPSN
jgi:hypothetical protein